MQKTRVREGREEEASFLKIFLLVFSLMPECISPKGTRTYTHTLKIDDKNCTLLCVVVAEKSEGQGGAYAGLLGYA